jgi:hypothetical protein
LKVAVYARHSSDNQRDASIADQLRVCREFAAPQGWTVVQEFTDHAISGATLLRSGFQGLMRDALNQRFDVVLAEALDRFSRDQEDTAGLFKRLTFAGVNIVTLAEGDITHLHVGLKGTMNALFLKDLADKTRRGLRGRVDPDTGKRVSRPNPPSDWVTTAVPELRIVDDELWTLVKARQAEMRRVTSNGDAKRFNHARRPKYLFSGLTKCAECGGGSVMYWRDRLACFGARSRGVCTNRLTISRQEVEERVLVALREKLMRRDLFETSAGSTFVS